MGKKARGTANGTNGDAVRTEAPEALAEHQEVVEEQEPSREGTVDRDGNWISIGVIDGSPIGMQFGLDPRRPVPAIRVSRHRPSNNYSVNVGLLTPQGEYKSAMFISDNAMEAYVVLLNISRLIVSHLRSCLDSVEADKRRMAAVPKIFDRILAAEDTSESVQRVIILEEFTKASRLSRRLANIGEMIAAR